MSVILDQFATHVQHLTVSLRFCPVCLKIETCKSKVRQVFFHQVSLNRLNISCVPLANFAVPGPWSPEDDNALKQNTSNPILVRRFGAEDVLDRLKFLGILQQ